MLRDFFPWGQEPGGAAPGDSPVWPVFVSWQEEGPGRRRGLGAGCSEEPGSRVVCLPACLPVGLSGPGQWLEGNSSMRLPVSAAAGFLPCRPLPPKCRRASPHHMQIVGKFTSVSFYGNFSPLVRPNPGRSFHLGSLAQPCPLCWSGSSQAGVSLYPSQQCG